MYGTMLTLQGGWRFKRSSAISKVHDCVSSEVYFRRCRNAETDQDSFASRAGRLFDVTVVVTTARILRACIMIVAIEPGTSKRASPELKAKYRCHARSRV